MLISLLVAEKSGFQLGIDTPEMKELKAHAEKLVADSAPSADQLRAYCRAHLAAHKTPYYWEFVEQFPLTPSGKVQKFALRDEFVARTSGSVPSVPSLQAAATRATQ